MESQQQLPQEKFKTWAIIEMMGHSKTAGFVEECSIAGHGMLRITVPQTTTSAEFEFYIPPSAVYRISPIDKELAIIAAEDIGTRPVLTYSAQKEVRRAIEQQVPTELCSITVSTETDDEIPDFGEYEDENRENNW